MTEPTSGFHHYRIGDMAIVAVADGSSAFAVPDRFVLNASRTEVEAALAAAGLDGGRLTIPYTPIVIDTGSGLIAIDTGTGEGNIEKSNGAAGLYQSNLARAGIDRAAIKVVVISHFHGDHINGLLDADNRPAFPNAAILVPEREWAFWMDDEEMSRAPAGRMSDLFANIRRVFATSGLNVSTYSWDSEVAPGIRAIGTPGHTPGHTSFLVSSGQGRVLVFSDVTNIPVLFARHPGWHAAFDQDPVAAEETRRRILDWAVTERLPVQGFHFPFPGIARFSKTETGYLEEPLQDLSSA